MYNPLMEPKKHPGGRPPIPPEKRLVARSIRLAPEQWAKIDEYKLDWLRKLIDKGKPPKPKP